MLLPRANAALLRKVRESSPAELSQLLARNAIGGGVTTVGGNVF